MARAEVVATGIGMVTPLGPDALSTIAAWRRGEVVCRSRLPELAGGPYEQAEAATFTLPPVDGRVANPRLLKYASTAGVLGCLAAAEAARDAAIRERFRPERIGLYAGSGMAASSVGESVPMVARSLDENRQFSAALLGSRGIGATNPLTAFKILSNMAPCLVSMMENIQGPSLIFTPWEGQTAAALWEAWSAVASGEVDCALAGAAEEATNPACLVHLRSSGRLRENEFPAAAAAYVVLERRETARRAYARIRSMDVICNGSAACDPLATRMGRTFAAAPAVLLALGCADPCALSLTGTDGCRFTAELEAAA